MAHIDVKRPDGTTVTYIIPRKFNSDRIHAAMNRSREAGESILWQLHPKEKSWVMDLLQEELEWRTAYEMQQARAEIEKGGETHTESKDE